MKQQQQLRGPDERYPVPSRPYQHGQARIKLLLCPQCRCWLPAGHPCKGEAAEQ